MPMCIVWSGSLSRIPRRDEEPLFLGDVLAASRPSALSLERLIIGRGRLGSHP
jgi:hypothetical protein